MRLIDADLLFNEINKDMEKAIEQNDTVGSFWLGYLASLVIEQLTVQSVATDTNDGDTINRQAAIETLDDEITITGKTNAFVVKNYVQRVKRKLEQLPSAQSEHKTEKALRLLVEWAIECGFGYNSIPKEYEKYKDNIANMGYIDGLIYIAERKVEHEISD